MLLYNWKKTFETTEGNASDCVLIFKMLTMGLIPKNRYDRIYKFYMKDYKGESFLAHPEVLVYNLYKYTNIEVGQYLALASMRSLADYLATGNTALDLFHNNIDRLLFQNNRLLTIENDIMTFLYEEVPTEKH
jgi:hypothetical protein